MNSVVKPDRLVQKVTEKEESQLESLTGMSLSPFSFVDFGPDELGPVDALRLEAIVPAA